MKKIYQYLIIIVLVSACQEAEKQITVQHFGVLREIMMGLKLEANANLADLPEGTDLYALGALEGLSGELIIIGGNVYKTTLKDSEPSTEHGLSGKATLMVTARVKEWEEVIISSPIGNMADLEKEVRSQAEALGIDTSQPFPFMLNGEFEIIASHVIYAPGATEQSHDAYKQSGSFENLKGVDAQVLGFYSEQHKGVFTHHDSFIHAHVLFEGNAAHVDGLNFQPGIHLKLPKTM